MVEIIILAPLKFYFEIFFNNHCRLEMPLNLDGVTSEFYGKRLIKLTDLPGEIENMLFQNGEGAKRHVSVFLFR